MKCAANIAAKPRIFCKECDRKRNKMAVQKFELAKSMYKGMDFAGLKKSTRRNLSVLPGLRRFLAESYSCIKILLRR